MRLGRGGSGCIGPNELQPGLRRWSTLANASFRVSPRDFLAQRIHNRIGSGNWNAGILSVLPVRCRSFVRSVDRSGATPRRRCIMILCASRRCYVFPRRALLSKVYLDTHEALSSPNLFGRCSWYHQLFPNLAVIRQSVHIIFLEHQVKNSHPPPSFSLSFRSRSNRDFSLLFQFIYWENWRRLSYKRFKSDTSYEDRYCAHAHAWFNQ